MDITSDGVLLCVELSSYTGTARLEWQDKDKGVLTSGVKRLIARNTLQPFATMATQVGRLCDEYGIKLFKRSWFVCNDVLPELAQKLDAIKTQWVVLVQDFLKHYARYCGQWLDSCANPSLRKAVRQAQPDAASIAERFSFGIRAFGIQPIVSVGDTDALINSIPDRALEQALDLLQRSGRTSNSLALTAQKCSVFVFANPCITRLVFILKQLANMDSKDTINQTIDALLAGDAVAMIDRLFKTSPQDWMRKDSLLDEAEELLARPVAMLDSNYVLDNLGLF